MKKIISVITFIVFGIIFLFPYKRMHAQNNLPLADKVTFGESQTRYYLHYDRNGNSPENLGIDRLANNIRVGDEIVVRFYPNTLFAFDPAQMDITVKTETDVKAKIIYPLARKEGVSVQEGYGSLYFASLGSGKYRLKISDKQTDMNLGDNKNYADIIDAILETQSDSCSDFNPILYSKGYSKDWQVRLFKDIQFENGKKIIEVFKILGKNAELVAREVDVNIGTVYENMKILLRTEGSEPQKINMEKIKGTDLYEGIIGSDLIKTSSYSLNIVTDYAKDSWAYNLAPLSAKNDKIITKDQEIVVSKEKELPNSVRVRTGFAVFNEGREPRLIANLVMILNSKNYFSDSTPFLQCFNPTLGLQVGGTGDNDIILLLGMSIKLIKEGDLICGLRFQQITEGKWNESKNFYFGITLDPGLFNFFKSSAK
jgi:hypothetical protein